MPRGGPRSTPRPRAVPRKLAKLGRFDGEVKEYGFVQGDTVAVLLTKAGITLHEGESLIDGAGKDVANSDKVKTGAVYYITGNYKQGL